MQYNPATDKAVDLDALANANRELISKLPSQPSNTLTWSPEHLAYRINIHAATDITSPFAK